MNLYSSLLPSEQGPFKDTQTKVDCRGVKRIHVPAECEEVRSTAFLRLGNDPIGKFLEDPLVSVGIGFRQVAERHALAKTKVIALVAVGGDDQDQVSQTISVAQLAEHQDEQLVPAGERLHIAVAIVLVNDVSELVAVQEFG